MKSSLRAFGIGLFVAGMCFTLSTQFGFFSPDEKSVITKEEQEENTQLKAAEASKPLPVAQVEEEALPTEPTTEKDAKSEEVPAQDNVTPTESDVKIATIFIYEGMSLYEIGRQVEGEGIVLNGREVELYLSRPEYSRSIQKGAFDLRSDMTIEEIAKVLTGKK